MNLYRYDREGRWPSDQRDVAVNVGVQRSLRREYRVGRRTLKLSPFHARLYAFGWVAILDRDALIVGQVAA